MNITTSKYETLNQNSKLTIISSLMKMFETNADLITNPLTRRSNALAYFTTSDRTTADFFGQRLGTARKVLAPVPMIFMVMST